MWYRILTLAAILVLTMVAQAPAAESGRATSWGSYQGYRPEKARDLTMVSAGENHTVGLRRDGTVVAWGGNGGDGLGAWGACNVPAGLSGVTAIAAGMNGSHTLALRQDGTVVAWGKNSQGQSTVPTGLSGITAIAAGA